MALVKRACTASLLPFPVLRNGGGEIPVGMACYRTLALAKVALLISGKLVLVAAVQVLSATIL